MVLETRMLITVIMITVMLVSVTLVTLMLLTVVTLIVGFFDTSKLGLSNWDVGHIGLSLFTKTLYLAF